MSNSPLPGAYIYGVLVNKRFRSLRDRCGAEVLVRRKIVWRRRILPIHLTIANRTSLRPK